MITIAPEFQWECHPLAESLVLNILADCCKANESLAKLEKDLFNMTSTRLFDWLDHVSVGYSPEIEKALQVSGFVSEIVTATYRVFHHPGAQLPRVVMHDSKSAVRGAAVAVDRIGDFLLAHATAGTIEGTPLSGYRRCCVSTDNGVSLWVIERRGTYTMEPTYTDAKAVERYLLATELWQARSRGMEDESEAMAHTIAVAEQMIALVGENLAAWILLECERQYWQSRNTAAQVQKARQDRLGMGWANHDHHTFRSSRRLFPQLVRLFEMFGFICRERFYAGQEAGWGAQVMEHPHSRLVLFLDVDLQPHELNVDFRQHEVLPPLDKLGTVGLWCGLHGDSILQSGMHHLEAQFMFEDLKRDLATQGVAMMEPFSAMPHLHQAFTKGEIWKVSERRLEKLLKEGKITATQAEKFRSQGAVGSHMENLQRRDGFKGFNQRNVSDIITKTDPRNINF